MGSFVLAIDQGTTGSRATVFDGKGKVVAHAYQEFPQYYPKPGWVEHDTDEIWSSVDRVIRSAIKKAKISKAAISAIGITNQRETTVLWDRITGKPLYRAIVWQDRRTTDFCASKALNKHQEYIHTATGLRLDPYFSATKIHWLLANVPGLRKKAEAGDLCFGTVDSWLMYKLSGGALHMTDMTNASRTMLFNIKTKKWDTKLLKIFGIPLSILPQVFPSGHIFGSTSSVAGLPANIPIAAVMGDQQSALYGQGCFAPGTLKNTYGTGCFVLLNLGQRYKVSRDGLITTLACDANGQPVYALEGSVFIAGAVVHWLRDGLRIISDSSTTEKHIARVEDSGGVYFVPAFAGLGAPYWDPQARGIITGLTRGTKADHIVRAAVESIAYQSKDVFDLMVKTSGLKIIKLAVDGGACRNDFLMQFQADMLGVSVMRPKMVDTTVAGAAHLAGIVTGVWKVKDLGRMRGVDRVFVPRMKRSEANARYAGWQGAVRRAL